MEKAVTQFRCRQDFCNYFLVNLGHTEINMGFDFGEIFKQPARFRAARIIYRQATTRMQCKQTFEQTTETVVPGQITQKAHTRLWLPQYFEGFLL